MAKYRRAVFIVTYRKEEGRILYLLLKRKLHWKGWEFPKGGVEEGEKLKNTAKREIFEEVGQKAINVRGYGFYGKYKYKRKYPDRGGIIGQTYQLFSAEVNSKNVKMSENEHSSYKWLKFDEAVKLLTWENQKRCLRYVDKRIK